MFNGATYRVEELGHFRLRREPSAKLTAGEVGYVVAGVKTVSDTRPGDTITLKDNPAAAPLPGFREMQQVVFSSLYPVTTNKWESMLARIRTGGIRPQEEAPWARGTIGLPARDVIRAT